MNAATKITLNKTRGSHSPSSLFSERSTLLELATTAMHPSLDEKNRALASRFLMKQLLGKLKDPTAPFSQVKVYLDVFKKVSEMGLIKADQTGHQIRTRDNFENEFRLLTLIRNRRNTKQEEWGTYHSNEELVTNRLRWKIVEFLKYLT
ncbi:MAG: hypothetical protein ACJAT2_001140 [Bacteriovoracaceae bacterium]|jgi:hypothetical protein